MENMNETYEVEAQIDSTCFGEYGKYSYCPQCKLAIRCKKFRDAENEVSRRYKGKYTGTGKERARDKY